jgi:hypothetical protein
MQDETINIVFALLLFFGFMSVMRGRGLSRRSRRMQEEIDYLRSSQAKAAPAVLPGASREQLERLEDRVRVLERIVTDRGSTLAAEIEALRDRAPVTRQVEETNT